jgi:hypothetical protein
MRSLLFIGLLIFSATAELDDCTYHVGNSHGVKNAYRLRNRDNSSELSYIGHNNNSYYVNLCESSGQCHDNATVCAYRQGQYNSMGKMNSSEYSFTYMLNQGGELTLRYTKGMNTRTRLLSQETATTITITCGLNEPEITSVTDDINMEIHITGEIGCPSSQATQLLVSFSMIVIAMIVSQIV